MFKKGKTTKKKSKPIMLRLLIALTVLLFVEIGFAARVVGSSSDEDIFRNFVEDVSCVESTAIQTEGTICESIGTEPTYIEAEAEATEIVTTEVPEDLESENASVPHQEAETVPTTEPAEPISETAPESTSEQPAKIELSEEDKNLLLRIAMAEVGCDKCVECAALVMRTVLNRIESDDFSDSVYDVLHAKYQFEPVWNGTFKKAVPNEICEEALELVLNGWDESQGALYFEACIGPSWHSRNLKVLFRHCSTRFYVEG